MKELMVRARDRRSDRRRQRSKSACQLLYTKPVLGISDNRVACVGHMDSDLMGAARFQRHFENSQAVGG